ncbi:MAG: nuclear transport factor 2 family protein [Phycisphaerae bacterium]|nr:nuclear transport factor 2 family protein [Phycisphaerae bacterium]
MQSDVLDLSERWFQAWLDKDAATVIRLASEDYIYIGPSGLFMDRDGILAVIRSPGYSLDRGTRTEVVVRAMGPDAAVVRHRYQGVGSFEGTTFTDDHRCVMVWQRNANEWRLVMEQCSFTSP